MWFDAKAKLAEITEDLPATSATIATKEPRANTVSRLSQVSQAPETRTEVSNVATVANVAKPYESEQPDNVGAETYGESPGGRALTWTGRVVSLDAWRELSEWEKHGPNGRRWNGLSQSWETP